MFFFVDKGSDRIRILFPSYGSAYLAKLFDMSL